MFETIFNGEISQAAGFFITVAAALIAGGLFSFLSCYRSRSSGNFGIAAALIPTAVAVVVILVNGNLGVGVAIAGAFGLVRFRSAPGTAKEIAVIFIAMASGLAFGMGFLAYGGIFLLLSGAIFFVYERTAAPTTETNCRKRVLKITIPEALDYTSIFDEVFSAYTVSAELLKVKSANMGSMFRLTYEVILKKDASEKKFLDDLRIRNGNLEIESLRADMSKSDL